jgi:LacI family transcriptional regulator, galactose operon repressor
MLDEPNRTGRRTAATIKSIADALSLSPSTVSRALRGESSVHPDTTLRIREAARHMGYRRDFRGVNLRTGRTNTLCAILTSLPTLEFGDPAAMHLMQGLIAGVEGTDLKLVIQPVAGEAEQFAALTDAVEASRFDGIVIDHTRPRDARVDYLIDSQVPFVTFGRTERAVAHAFFDLDNEDAASLATIRLLERGHRRIALIDPPVEFLFSAQRRRGYLETLRQAGVSADPSLIIETDINPGSVGAAVTALLGLPRPPTAFVTSNEVATLAAVQACRQFGADLSHLDFVSRDGTRFFDFFVPAVSSCYYPQFEAGRVLSEMLVEAVNGAPVEALHRLVRTEFISR